MGQVHVRVVLTNHREAVMAQFGQLDADRVHHYETEALIDTGATRAVNPFGGRRSSRALSDSTHRCAICR